MSLFSKVAWKEGLFLQPQHLQQSDRYIEHLMDTRLRRLRPYIWGFTDLVIDRDMAQQGKIALRRVSGIMPDGLVFDAPDAGQLPQSVVCPEDAAGQFIWLTVPEASPNGRDIGPDEADASTRYRLSSESVADNAAGARIEQLVEIAVPRLELAIRRTPRPGYQCLRIARIHEMRDGVIALDDTVPPPALILGTHPVLGGYLSRVLGWVEAKLETLARYAADPSSGGGMQASDYLMLMTLNREVTVLRHMSALDCVHPEELYRRLIGLAGELATFDNGARLAPQYPPYDHAEPKESFTPVVMDIQRALSRDVGRAVRLPLRMVRQNSYLAEVADRNLFREATFVIEVESAKPLAQVMMQFPQLCKVGPNTRMSEIVKNNLPGIGLVHLPNPPRQIRVVASNVYFLLDRNTPLWSEFSNAPAIGMHFAGDWPELKLEFWAIPEKI
ncbi:type VI secretion system protein ImpJ [Rhodobacter aestuarii]|uniref:Type VI secretion system protein ImpJ n=1 Tax=Rhodobacter aestuarii TaxID=453582 RepID=A0A1N7JX88_9RHOB|nr:MULTISPECIES: type VI secretion system baseplate subunit TssK [Rhodobacter]PTV95953.1 type VI secretion system protein ImpJ [Rhodobacter aestuarii]SIS53856.1 type VI secretion system protein ImpJ [Rhodobacter aestuarii]SOC10624.1 type VI secretion system protein ImpJ [Rhodobacter sp. JA431]